MLKRRQRPDPDVSVADGVAVKLQSDGAFAGHGLWIFGDGPDAGGPVDRLVVLHDNAVLKDGYVSGDGLLPLPISRGVKDDVIRLPLARRAADVRLRRVLPVNRPALPVGVGGVLVTVEHLNFENAHQEHAAVPAALAFAARGRRLGPLD